MTDFEKKGITQLDKLRAEINERFAKQHAARLAREDQTPQPDDQEDIQLDQIGQDERLEECFDPLADAGLARLLQDRPLQMVDVPTRKMQNVIKPDARIKS